jgi:hypothetical protein
MEIEATGDTRAKPELNLDDGGASGALFQLLAPQYRLVDGANEAEQLRKSRLLDAVGIGFELASASPLPSRRIVLTSKLCAKRSTWSCKRSTRPTCRNLCGTKLPD